MNLYFSNIKMDGMTRLKGELDYHNKMDDKCRINALNQVYPSELKVLQSNIRNAVNMLEIVYEDFYLNSPNLSNI